MKPKLKPCPFCGGTDIQVYACFSMILPKLKPQVWIAECGTCDAHGPMDGTKGLVIKAWNRRNSCSPKEEV